MNYRKIYSLIILGAKHRGLNKKKLEGYYEKHHIVPKCLGASNEDNNLVLLTAREHFICHLLLCKMYKNNMSLLYAFNTLKNCSGFNSRKYSATRKEFSKLFSKKQLGALNHMYGKRGADCIFHGRPLLESTKAKISLKVKGVLNPFYGRKHTKETIEHLSAINKGKKLSIECRSKISKSNTGKHTGKLNPMYGKKGPLNPNYGRPLSEWQKQRVREGAYKRLNGNHCNAIKVRVYNINNILIKEFSTIKEATEAYKVKRYTIVNRFNRSKTNIIKFQDMFWEKCDKT